jgi:hypothetical protein
MRDEKRLKELMNAESFDPTQRDMFDQNVVELALMCDDPRTVLTLFASPKVFAVLEQNHNLLVKALSYLVVLARDEKSEFSKEAFMLFKQEQEKVGSNDSWRAFYEAAKLGVDKKLVDFLKTKSDEEIIAAIERREISARDRFGNSFVTYMFEADKFKLWDEKIKKQFLIGPENSFIPFEPLHAAIGDNSPEQFLAALNKLKEANKPLPERLQRYEKNDSPMNHVRFRLRSSYSDEWNVNGQKTAGWIAVFKKLVTDFNVDPVADAALLRRELRAEIVKDFPSELEMRIEVEGNKIEKSRLEKKQDEKKEKDGDKKSLAKPVAQKLQQEIQQQDKPLGV